MPQVTRLDALECGLRLAHDAATGSKVLDVRTNETLRRIGLNPNYLVPSVGEVDVTASYISGLEVYAQRAARELHTPVTWLIVGFYATFLLSREGLVVDDPPLPGTLKNAVDHVMDTEREWLSKAGLSRQDVDEVMNSIAAGFRSSPLEKATIVSNTIRLLREDAMRQDEQDSRQSSVPQAPANPWLSGSFYLASALILLAGVAVIAKLLPYYALPIVLIGGVLLVITTGLLQLLSGGQMKEKTFAALIREVLKRLPLLNQRKP